MPASQRARLIWGFLFVILCGVLIARATRKEAGVMQLNRDFGARFLAGDDPYWNAQEEERTHRPYPPSFALVCAPLALLPEKAARASWAALQCLALTLAYQLLARRWRKRFPERAHQAPAWFALTLLLISRFLLRDMAAGGGNLIYATLAYLALELVLDEDSDSKRNWASGALLGFVLAVKPNLLPLVLFLTLIRRLRAAGAALACAVLWFLVPAAYYGPNAYLELTQGWAADVTTFAQLEDLHDSSLVPEGMPPARNGMNQSLRSAVHRLTRPPGDSGAPDVHLFELPPAAASWLARGLTVLLLLACCWKAWRARDPKAAG